MSHIRVKGLSPSCTDDYLGKHEESEPTASLDPRHRLVVLEALRRRATRGSTVLLSTHGLEFAAGADRAVLLAAGRILAEGTVRETLTAPLLSELFGVAARIVPLADGTPLVSLGHPVE